jgi:pimeloyl-ACP methyl ester carboxylesterase
LNDPKYVDVKGIKTRYFEAGEGEPLVLVHGGSFGSHSNAEDWEMNFDTLSRSYHTFAYDKIGMGFTDNPHSDEEYVIGANVQHLYDFMEAVGIDSAHVAGHSRGGYAVTRLALEHPDVVRSLIIIDSSTLMTPPNPIYDEWDRQAAQIPDPREAMRHRITSNSFTGEHITDRYLDVCLEIKGMDKTAEANAKMKSGLVDQFKTDLVAKQKETHEWIMDGGIKAPTLVIWAYNDPSATMERCGIPCMQLIMSSVPDSEMCIINQSGHSVFREQPDAFHDAVTNFISARTDS